MLLSKKQQSHNHTASPSTSSILDCPLLHFVHILTLMYSVWPKLHWVWAILSAVELMQDWLLIHTSPPHRFHIRVCIVYHYIQTLFKCSTDFPYTFPLSLTFPSTPHQGLYSLSLHSDLVQVQHWLPIHISLITHLPLDSTSGFVLSIATLCPLFNAAPASDTHFCQVPKVSWKISVNGYHMRENLNSLINL